jgi:hypothetical protein
VCGCPPICDRAAGKKAASRKLPKRRQPVVTQLSAPSLSTTEQ